ncbi:MAG: autoinducer binding domain-containing protein [Alphaproteobacteria bacterium]|nr:autoinducer binding domain-containing protein [Alphaproteobacteria bacterium]
MGAEIVASRLFEFLEEARDATTMATLDACFSNLIDDWGFDRWTATPISSAVRGNIRPFEIVFGKPSRNWSAHYRERGYFRHDAVLSHMMRSTEAGWWTRFSKEARLSHEERMLFDESRAFGVAEGLTAPVRLPDGSVWVCALTGEQPNPRSDVADAARFAAERYILQALELRRPMEPGVRSLNVTAGQAQIIELLSRGHTLREAADALEIRPSTAYNQIADAKRRVMVKTTAELVHKTSGRGPLEKK